MTCGIYRVRNTTNDHGYYGSSYRIEVRWDEHRWWLRRGDHDNRSFQTAWTRDGEDAFVFEILEECDRDDLESREQFYLDNVVRWGVDYNQSTLVGRPPKVQRARTEAENRANAERNIARRKQLGLEHHLPNGMGFKGRTHSAETKLKMRNAKLGRPNPRKRL